MTRADPQSPDACQPSPDDVDAAPRSAISVALLAAVALMPIVVAAGFLTDRPQPGVPGDISVLSLRGVLDGAPADRPTRPAQAGY